MSCISKMNRKELLITLKKSSNNYIDAIINYIELVTKSTAKIDRRLTHMGYKIIAHVYQTNLIHTGDIDLSQYSMRKGCLYYLEYLEQIEMSNVCNNINCQSPMLFIYDKTLIKYTEDNREAIKVDRSILSTVPRITKLIDTILWFGNNTIEQVNIEYDVVKSLCELLNNTNDSIINTYIEFGQNRSMTTVEYNDFLHRTLKIFCENAKNKTHSEGDLIEKMLKKISHIEEAKNMVISKWCKWLWI
jgi:hypothetical protein